MVTISDFSIGSQLAFASYATLRGGTPSTTSLVNEAEMAVVQADKFASEWRVVDQYNGSNGVSATVFEGIEDQRRYLAIRGTELTSASAAILDIAADTLLALGVPEHLNPQYLSLRQKVEEWVADGTLGTRFSVAGHSLGGYLAAAIGLDFSPLISGIFVYNAPGIGGGVVGSAADAIARSFGLNTAASLPNAYNLRGASGLSLIAGLGAQIAPPTLVEIEGASGLGLSNHLISKISDSLAVQALLAHFGPSFDLNQLSEIVSASSIRPESALERALSPLQIVLGLETVPTGDREALYSAIDAMTTNEVPSVELRSLVGKSKVELQELALSEDGIAYRYALDALNPYAVLGDSVLYSGLPGQEAGLGLYDGSTGYGLTPQYLEDRARMLAYKNKYLVADGNVLLLGDTSESYLFSDRRLAPDEGHFTVRGRQIGTIGNPAYVTFGSSQSETLTGGEVAIGDHLYGMGGDDFLDGQGGSDYLEGGLGDDRLRGGEGDDELAGGIGFDTYEYEAGDGFDTILDPDGMGRIQYSGRTLSGGTKIADGVYQDEFDVEYFLLDEGAGSTVLLINGDIYVEGFFGGMLGISLGGDVEADEAPESDAAHVYSDQEHPEDYDPRDEDRYAKLRNLYGSSADDLFLNAGMFEVFGRSGSDVAIVSTDGTYGASMNLGSGDDYVDGSASSGSSGAARIVGGSGNDYIIGSAGSDAIWGDNYRAYSAELFSGPLARFIGQFLIDDFGYNTDTEPRVTFLGDLSPGYGKYLFLGQVVDLAGVGFSELSDTILLPDGSATAGSLQDAIEFVLGTAGAFDDYIEAGDGDDLVVGGSGSDDIFGGAGDDRLGGDDDFAGREAPRYRTLEAHFGAPAALFGKWGDDRMDGGDGNDTLRDQSGGNDVLLGGDGDDVLYSEELSWSPEDGEGSHNTIHGGAGNDTVDLGNRTGGFDVVDGGSGDDWISVFSRRYSIDADEDGVPESFGSTPGRAVVFGGAGNDFLYVDADAAAVDGGSGDDDYTFAGGSVVMSDGEGYDTVHLGLVDLSGVDAALEAFPVLDPEDEADRDASDQVESTIVRREGSSLVYTSQLVVDGELVSGLEIEFADWFSGATHMVERITLGWDEDPFISSAQFESWGGLHVGAGADDVLADASEFSDRALGYGGDDLIATGAGDDRISGGRGDDELYGGSGNDTYYYASGDGNDVVHESSGFDEVRFGPGISLADITVELSDVGISIAVGDACIAVVDASRADPGVDRLRFADGSTQTVSELLPPLPEPDPAIDPVPKGDGADSGSGEAGSETLPDISVPIAATLNSPHGATPSDVPGNAGESEFASQPDVVFRSDILKAAEIENRTADSRVTAFSASPSPQSSGPLELSELLDALETFESGGFAATPRATNDGSPAGETAESAAAQSISSWALTNALLEFHLSRADRDGVMDGAADWFAPADPMAGLGTGPGALQSGFQAFGRSAQSLPTFSGLQEGLARLT